MRLINREDKVDIMIESDMEFIKAELIENNMLNFDDTFLYSVLSGEGWKQYIQLTDEQVDTEFRDRFCDNGLYLFANGEVYER